MNQTKNSLKIQKNHLFQNQIWAEMNDASELVSKELETASGNSEGILHVWFIMDGNRRWATAKNLAKHLWHHQGAKATENIVELCVKNEIEIVSFWALAKKNILERSEQELTYLYDLFERFLEKIEASCVRNQIRFEAVGDMDLLPKSLRDSLMNLKNLTRSFSKMTLILAIGYGGQDEIVRATKRAIQAWVDPETLNEKTFLKFLDTGSFPPPDLIVRTGGDVRHSGYFLYQAEYSEYYFTETLWPDFGEEEFLASLLSLKNAKRNFWK